MLEELRELEKKWSEEGMRNEIKVQEKRGEGINVKKEGTIGGGYSSLTMEDMDRFPGLNDYSDGIEKIIYANWKTPLTQLDITDKGKRVIVSFTILKDGKIHYPIIKSSSGNIVLDRFAIKAVNDSSPLPPLPPSYNKSSLSVSIGLVYE
jgi:TonB family protein